MSFLASLRLCLLGVCVIAAPAVVPAQNTPIELGKSNSRLDPYRFIGRILFTTGTSSALGSGTVISRKTVLSCAHVVFDPEAGFSTNFVFERGRYGGSTISQQLPSSATVLAGYRQTSDHLGKASFRAFGRDLALVRFAKLVAHGASADWGQRMDLLRTDGVLKQALGYGAVQHSGEELLIVESTDRLTYAAPGFYLTGGMLLEAGMSGGPLFVPTEFGLEVAAVNVAGSSTQSGYRVIDGRGARFIRTRLNK